MLTKISSCTVHQIQCCYDTSLAATIDQGMDMGIGILPGDGIGGDLWFSRLARNMGISEEANHFIPRKGAAVIEAGYSACQHDNQREFDFRRLQGLMVKYNISF